MPVDLVGVVWAGKPVAPREMALRGEEDGIFLAAAAACGFLPFPRLGVAADGGPVVGLPEESVTFPGLRLEHFEQEGAEGAGCALFVAGARAVAHWQRFCAHEAAQAQATYMRRSPFDEQKVAFVSAGLFEGNGEVRDEVEEFLSAA